MTKPQPLPTSIAKAYGNLGSAERFPVKLTREMRFLAADFPGWGDPNYADHFVELPAGTIAWATSSESHGMNPWRRWTIQTEAGETRSGSVETDDFIVAR